MVQPSYRPILEKDGIQVRVSGRKIHLLTHLSEKVVFKNQQITMQGTALPNVLLDGLIGSPVKKLFDKAPYDDAFKDEIISEVEVTPTGTTILKIESSENIIKN